MGNHLRVCCAIVLAVLMIGVVVLLPGSTRAQQRSAKRGHGSGIPSKGGSGQVAPNAGGGGIQTDASFSNTTPIVIPLIGNAAPYPSTIAVAGLTGTVTKVVVQFSGFSHTFPDDIAVVLVGPTGAALLLMDGVAEDVVTDVTFTVADSGSAPLPDIAAFGPGIYTPAGYFTGDSFPAPGPLLVYNHPGPAGGNTATFASTFNGTAPNGNWNIFIRDFVNGDAGTVAGGWTLGITTTTSPTAGTGAVTGRITDTGGAAVAGALVNLSGNQSRNTITDGNGNYRFNEVETNGFYAVTPTRANYQFSPSSRSFTQLGNQTDAGFSGSFTGDNANPVETNEYFVRQQYLDFLGREPDEGGLAFWSNRINGCAGDVSCIRQSRIDVSAAFFRSDEFQLTGSFVYNLYAAALGRGPGFGEFGADRSQIAGGSGLDAAKAKFAEGFIQRSEFTSRYPQSMSREQFVDAAIQTMQVRSGMFMTSLRDGLLSDYDSGGRSLVVRHAAEAGMFVSAEYNKAFVLMEYFGYLQRGEDQSGYNFWLNALNQGGASNYQGMVCSFLTSAEYQNRFSSVIARNNSECGL